MLTFAVRVLALLSTFGAYYATFTFMENLDKNPLASLGIWGIASAVTLSFSVIYLINANKEINEQAAKEKRAS